MDIQAGTYKGRAIAGSAQYGHTDNGNEQIALDIDVPDLGRALTVFLFFSDKAAPYSIDKLRACGWKGDDISNLVGIDANEVQVVVRYEEYKGEQKMKVDILTGGTVKLKSTMDDKQKRAFAARMRAFTAGGQANGALRESLKQSPGGFGPKDDDIPFAHVGERETVRRWERW